MNCEVGVTVELRYSAAGVDFGRTHVRPAVGRLDVEYLEVALTELQRVVPADGLAV